MNFWDGLKLAAVMTPDGMMQLRRVIETAKDDGADAVRTAVYREYPWAEDMLRVALDRDPEGAFQYVLEVAEESFGAMGVSMASQYRDQVYQIHAWLQGEIDKPRPELLGRGERVSG